MKSSFILYTDQQELLEALDAAQRGHVFSAIYTYVSTGEIPELELAEKIAFLAIKRNLDADDEKYRKKCEDGKKNGIAGGRPKKTQGFSADTEKTQGFSDDTEKTKGFFEKPKKPDTDTDTDTDTEEKEREATPPQRKEAAPLSPPAPKQQKHKHGEYKNVLLTDEEYQKLKSECRGYDALIENLSAYMASTGKAYKSHYATIRNWARRDANKAPPGAYIQRGDPMRGVETIEL